MLDWVNKKGGKQWTARVGEGSVSSEACCRWFAHRDWAVNGLHVGLFHQDFFDLQDT